MLFELKKKQEEAYVTFPFKGLYLGCALVTLQLILLLGLKMSF